MNRVDLSIDNPVLEAAKTGFNECMRLAIDKAIETGSNEGSITLNVSFEIMQTADKNTGEIIRRPFIKFKAGYSVPMKQSITGTLVEDSRLMKNERCGVWMLADNQISMDDLIEDDEMENA